MVSADHEVGLVNCVVLFVGLLHATYRREMQCVYLRVRYLVELFLAGVLYQVNLLFELVKAGFGRFLSGRERVSQLGMPGLLRNP